MAWKYESASIKTVPTIAKPTREEVSFLAYRLYERDGKHLEHCFHAESMVKVIRDMAVTTSNTTSTDEGR